MTTKLDRLGQIQGSMLHSQRLMDEGIEQRNRLIRQMAADRPALERESLLERIVQAAGLPDAHFAYILGGNSDE